MKRYLHYLIISFIVIIFICSFVKYIKAEESSVIVEFYFSEGCDLCEEKKPVIDEIENYYNNTIQVLRLSLDIPENEEKFYSYNFSNYPGVVVLNQSNNKYNIFQYESITFDNLKNSIDYHLKGNYSIEQPKKEKYLDTPFGRLYYSNLSLPILTIILAGLDSINPCSFFVLLFLLSLLIYTKSRKRMLLIGGIFVFFSAFIYFILMILIMFFFVTIRDQIPIVFIGGIIALIFGILNIKDFFFFKKGPSLSISDSKKPKLYSQMRKIIKITSIPALIIATIVFATSANMVELVCSLNLPVIYTGILTTYQLSNIQNIFYLIAYNFIYVIPLIVIVTAITITLGKWKLSEIQGRKLKLFSGLMMFLLSIVMLVKPGLLNDVFTAIIILVITIIVTLVISKFWKNKDLNIEKTRND
jgi:hypothetical protein